MAQETQWLEHGFGIKKKTGSEFESFLYMILFQQTLLVLDQDIHTYPCPQVNLISDDKLEKVI